MPLEFTRKGYIEVWLGDELISRHTIEREAIESVSQHSIQHGSNEYEIRKPTIVAKAYGVLAPGDTIAPSVPQNPLATVVSATEVDISWDDSTDNEGVVEYQIWRDNMPVASSATSPYRDTGLSPSTGYTWKVAAVDAAGNTSGLSDDAVATTNANTAPVWQTIAQQDLKTTEAYSLDLNTVCTDADSDPIAFSVVSGSLPSGVTLVGSIVSGTPDTVESQAVVFRRI